MTIKSTKKAALTCSLAEPPVSRFPKRDIDLDWATRVVISPSTFSKSLKTNTPAGLSGKTSPEFCQAETGRISPPSSKRWLTAGMACAGECWTLDLLGSPKIAKESSLLAILEATGDALEPYYLSTKHLVTTLREAYKRRGVYLYVRYAMREMQTPEVLLWLKYLVNQKLAETRDLNMKGRTSVCDD